MEDEPGGEGYPIGVVWQEHILELDDAQATVLAELLFEHVDGHAGGHACDLVAFVQELPEDGQGPCDVTVSP